MSKSSNKSGNNAVRQAAASMSSVMFTLRNSSVSAPRNYEVKTSGSFSSLERKNTDRNDKK